MVTPKRLVQRSLGGAVVTAVYLGLLLLFPVIARAVEITTTGIIGFGTAIPSGALSPGSNAVPLNDVSVALVNYAFVTNSAGNVLLVTDGTAATIVQLPPPAGAFVELIGSDISNTGTLTYTRRVTCPSGSGVCRQMFSLPSPYTNGESAQSGIDPRAVESVTTNSLGHGAVDFDVSGGVAPEEIHRLNGDGTTTPLVTYSAQTGYATPFGGVALRAKILENDDIYVAVQNNNVQPQTREIWRFGHSDPPGTHTVIYSQPVSVGTIDAFDANVNGDLVVAEQDAMNNSWIKAFPANGTPYIVPGTLVVGSHRNVFINSGGLIAAVRNNELVYALPGGQAAHVLGAGDAFNGATILTIEPTSQMNASGQLTLYMQLSLSGTFEHSVIRVDPAATDLSITKVASPNPVNVGSTLAYTLTVTNNGPHDATGVAVQDALPAGLTFVSATPSQGTCGGTSTISCSLGALGNASSATVTIAVTPTQSGQISNTASVSGNEFDSRPENNSDTSEVTVNDAADLSISKTASPNPVIAGTSLTYTLTVTNGGPSNATGVTVSDTLPAGLTFVSSASSQGTCSGTSSISCSLGSLANGSSANVTIVVTPSQAGGVSNTASVSGNETDPSTSNNSDTRVVTVSPAGVTLSALMPAVLWIGQNDAVKQLKFDVKAEIFENSNLVGSGTLLGVPAGGSDFTKASLETLTLALNSTPQVQTGDQLALRVSVRSSCSGKSGAGVARLWYNGQPIDSGKPGSRDAGSRFGATIGTGASSVYFLRSAATLSTTAGTARQFSEAAVDDSVSCLGQPGRPYVSFGDWNLVLP